MKSKYLTKNNANQFDRINKDVIQLFLSYIKDPSNAIAISNPAYWTTLRN